MDVHYNNRREKFTFLKIQRHDGTVPDTVWSLPFPILPVQVLQLRVVTVKVLIEEVGHSAAQWVTSSWRCVFWQGFLRILATIRKICRTVEIWWRRKRNGNNIESRNVFGIIFDRAYFWLTWTGFTLWLLFLEIVSLSPRDPWSNHKFHFNCWIYVKGDRKRRSGGEKSPDDCFQKPCRKTD